MELVYYKYAKGNFGDDLNAWLWPKFFNNNKNDNKVFIGIGSILYNDFPEFKLIQDKNKIVFGTGIRNSYSPFEIDNTWSVKFLRGPLSAYTMNNQFEYIADAAYALSLAENFNSILNTPKKYDVSVIPYFKSLDYLNWKEICDQLGFHFISPSAEGGLENTLKEIAASRFVISEAMHGAIIADILRVPWNRFVFSTPYTEGPMVSEFKWSDWLYSIDKFRTNTTAIDSYSRGYIYKIFQRLTQRKVNLEIFFSSDSKSDVLNKLSKVNDYYLSSDSKFDTITNRINDKIIQLKKELE
jgi:succinoglycan biosynthesis protein ExoV